MPGQFTIVRELLMPAMQRCKRRSSAFKTENGLGVDSPLEVVKAQFALKNKAASPKMGKNTYFMKPKKASVLNLIKTKNVTLLLYMSLMHGQIKPIYPFMPILILRQSSNNT